MKMENNTLKRKKFRKSFTMIEILMVLIIFTILATILFPSFHQARKKAKFTRWYAFNRACNNDPDCLINFNFQQGSIPGTLSGSSPSSSAAASSNSLQGSSLSSSGKDGGSMLINGALGADVELFDSRHYNGYMQNISDWNGKRVDPDTYLDPRHASSVSPEYAGFEWADGGRWGRYKGALEFNGLSSAIVIPSSQGANFTPYDEFSVMGWVRFNSCENGDTPFSKSLWGTSKDAAAQYDMYINNYSSSTGEGSFDVDCFRVCGTWNSEAVDFRKGEWTHLALTYRYAHEEDSSGMPSNLQGNEAPPCQILAFINGQPLGDYVETYGENPSTCVATEWGTCYRENVPFIIGAAGGFRKYWNAGSFEDDGTLLDTLYLMPQFVFNGRMDEFLCFKKALDPGEVKGHYEMGKE